MNNMRRLLKTPTLRMSEGGGVATAQDLAAIQGANTYQAPDPAPDPVQADRDRRLGLIQKFGGVSQKANTFQLQMPGAISVLPQTPALFANGGEISPWSLRGIVKMMTPKTGNERYAEYEAAKAKAAQAAQQAPAPAPTPAPAPAQGISGYVGNGALDRRMKEAGLRDGGMLHTGQGGRVPGTGMGDKIPAKYEPGEFVVSNDMLDAAPGLREQLHGLRREVLADKGMTPAQADAGALRGGAVKAQQAFSSMPAPLAGIDLDLNRGARAYMPNTDPYASTANYARADALAQELRAPTSSQAVRAAAPIAPQVSPEVQWARQQAAARAAARLTTPAPAPAPSVLAQPAPASTLGRVKNAATAIGNGAKSIASGSVLDADVGAAAGRVLQGAKSLAGGLRSGVGRLAQPIALGMTANQVANTPTEAYANRMGTDFNGDELSSKALGLRAVGALADLGDTVTGGFATKTGNWLAGNGFNDNNADGTAPTLTPTGNIRGNGKTITQPQPIYSNANAASNARTLRQGVGADYGSLTGTPYKSRVPVTGTTQGDYGDLSPEGTFAKGQTDLGGGIAGSGPTYNGRPTSYTNIGADGKPTALSQVDSRTPDQIANGARQLAEARASLRNPDGSTWSPQDNAIMAANLRDGVDPYRGTSRQPANSGKPEGYFRMKARLDNEMANKQNDTARYAADAPARAKQIELNYAKQLRGMQGDIIRSANGNQQLAAQRLAEAGLDPTHIMSVATGNQALEKTTQEMYSKARERFAKDNMVYDADGKPDEAGSQAMTDISRRMFPGMETANDADYSKKAADMKDLRGMFETVRKNDRVGFEAFTNLFSADRSVPTTLPDVRGAKSRQVLPTSLIDRITTKNGSTVVSVPGRGDVDFGKLNDRQLVLLKQAIEQGWNPKEKQ